MIYILVEREQYENDVILGVFDSLEKATEARESYEKYLTDLCFIDIENYSLWTEIHSRELNRLDF